MTKLVKKAFKKAKGAARTAVLLGVMAAAAASPLMAQAGTAGLVSFRKYQERVFWDHETKTMLIHWSRQVGKSYTLASWAVDRLLRNPGRLVTVLSNSRANGLEFVLKCQEVCQKLGQALEMEHNHVALDQRTDISEDMKYDMMRGEVRITVDGRVGRILVLAANPRTARGFSGDLIMDEFAFHENSQAIWEAAEPIISSNPDFLCRIASTGNGKRNMFYQLISEGRIPYYRVRRSDAWAAGEIKIYSAVTGKEITPAQARAESSDKRAYDQNYECLFNDENSALLTQELINAAQREGVVIEDQEWSEATLIRLATKTIGDLFLGQDVGRNRDLSVQTIVEKIGQGYRIVAMLRMENMRLPAQCKQLGRVASLPKLKRGEIDMTGIGLGLVEFAQENRTWGRKIFGVNFGSSEAISKKLKADGKKGDKARVTELMATDMLQVFEDRRIEIPMDASLRDSLRKPEKIVSPGGRVSIAATRDDAGHADEFWSVALSIRASLQQGGAPQIPKASAAAVNRLAKRRNREVTA